MLPADFHANLARAVTESARDTYMVLAIAQHGASLTKISESIDRLQEHLNTLAVAALPFDSEAPAGGIAQAWRMTRETRRLLDHLEEMIHDLPDPTRDA